MDIGTQAQQLIYGNALMTTTVTKFIQLKVAAHLN